jgi:hypothetical protein
MYTGVVSVVAEDMGYVPVRSCCSGGEISYAFSTHGTMSILFEQGRSFQPPYEDTMEELETENLPGIMNFFELPIPVRASRYLAHFLSHTERAGRRAAAAATAPRMQVALSHLCYVYAVLDMYDTHAHMTRTHVNTYMSCVYAGIRARP